MNKPLTIEQLKSLEVGDWVWIELKDRFTLKCNNVIYDYKCSNKSLYFQVANARDNADKLTLLTPYEVYSLFLSYSDYGTKWLAYKNKEQAECKGEIVEQEEKLDTAIEILIQQVMSDTIPREELSCSQCLKADDVCVSGDCIKHWKNFYLMKAERRLAELKGEQI